ncbi:hypothetical protein [Streptomyces sp. NPDC059783]|uniref:hypothetical protein n=1 Tax=Streptomyces sp. NPDC059783 TaxID=3346944 RepID=UPI00366905BB
MIVMQPVVEAYSPEGFDLWPTAVAGPSGFLPLHSALSSAEVGSAVMCIAKCNDIDPDGDRPPRPADPLGSFLHGLLTFDTPFASGGLEVTDPSSGHAFLPGCCDGLEDWRDWYRLIEDGHTLTFGHEPVSPVAEHVGATVRLTANTDQPNSPVIELPATDLRALLAGVEQSLLGFLDRAAAWALVHLPNLDVPVTTALARAMDVPWPPAPPSIQAGALIRAEPSSAQRHRS